MREELEQDLELHFENGCIVTSSSQKQLESLPLFELDTRTKQFRAKGLDYKQIILDLRTKNLPYKDHVRAYSSLESNFKQRPTLRPYQTQALQNWVAQERRGVVALPTGAGKTILAVAAIQEAKRSTLVVVPTIDLLYQWRDVLESFFHERIGLLGDGQRLLESLTVSTYDSARLMMERIGNRFGLAIFDECHHLPSPQYQFIAQCAIAPFRLGLSATVERSDGKESLIYELLGPLVYEGKIADLVTKSLAPYDVAKIEVDLTESERQLYVSSRKTYLSFIQKNRIDFSKKDGWKRFLFVSSRSKEGREAFLAHRTQKLIAQRAAKKLDTVWDLLNHHLEEQMIIFTDDNEMAYRIASEFLLPVITHKTKDRERQKFLKAFKDGQFKTLVTSRVLNEGIDVPEASVAVIASGTSTVREHVQRLGRILRPKQGKHAVLYEIVAKSTNEIYVNERRRQHHAYQGPSED